MKKTSFTAILLIVSISTLFWSCEKDDKYTIENKQVSGTMTYITKSSVPIEFSNEGAPVTMQISMEGSGTISDLGELTMSTTFKFSLLTLQGYEFVTTYYGSDTTDSFTAEGASKLDQNFAGPLIELLSNGAGKFENIIGGGEQYIQIYPDQSGGTGQVSWTVTY